MAGDGAAALLGRWRKAQLERTWRLNREGRYEPWDRVTAAALEEVAPELPTESRERLAELWLTVPAFPDAAATLATLGSAGVRRAVLSNGTRAMIARALEAGGLDVDRILSVDDVRVYKTDPRVYALLDAVASPSPRPNTTTTSKARGRRSPRRRTGIGLPDLPVARLGGRRPDGDPRGPHTTNVLTASVAKRVTHLASLGNAPAPCSAAFRSSASCR